MMNQAPLKNQRFSGLTQFFTEMLCLILCISPINIVYAENTIDDTDNEIISLNTKFSPAQILGMTVHPDNPFQLDFFISPGDEPKTSEALNQEINKLIKYFLASLTVPKEEMWVNLSPKESNRIIANGLSQTDLGKGMLEQDYRLKQITASLMYPENEIGEQFWDKVYDKIAQEYGTVEIPTNTCNRVWIVPDRANIHRYDNHVFILDSHLKVLMEEEYIASRAKDLENSQNLAPHHQTLTANILKEIIIPAIEKEVNEGKNFAQLRQMFHSMILATWYKRNMSHSSLSQGYANQNKIQGIDIENKNISQEIYERYVHSYKEGIFNDIKEIYDPKTQEIIPYKYFSGGIDAKNLDHAMSVNTDRDKKSKLSQLKTALMIAMTATILLAPAQSKDVYAEPLSVALSAPAAASPQINRLIEIIENHQWQVKILSFDEWKQEGLPQDMPWGGAIAMPNQSGVPGVNPVGGIIYYLGEVRSESHLGHETTHVLQAKIPTKQMIKNYNNLITSIGNNPLILNWLNQMMDIYKSYYDPEMMDTINANTKLSAKQKEQEKIAFGANETFALLFGILTGEIETSQPTATCRMDPVRINQMITQLKGLKPAQVFLFEYYLHIGHDQKRVQQIFQHVFKDSFDPTDADFAQASKKIEHLTQFTIGLKNSSLKQRFIDPVPEEDYAEAYNPFRRYPGIAEIVAAVHKEIHGMPAALALIADDDRVLIGQVDEKEGKRLLRVRWKKELFFIDLRTGDLLDANNKIINDYRLKTTVDHSKNTLYISIGDEIFPLSLENPVNHKSDFNMKRIEFKNHPSPYRFYFSTKIHGQSTNEAVIKGDWDMRNDRLHLDLTDIELNLVSSDSDAYDVSQLGVLSQVLTKVHEQAPDLHLSISGITERVLLQAISEKWDEMKDIDPVWSQRLENFTEYSNSFGQLKLSMKILKEYLQDETLYEEFKKEMNSIIPQTPYGKILQKAGFRDVQFRFFETDTTFGFAVMLESIPENAPTVKKVGGIDFNEEYLNLNSSQDYPETSVPSPENSFPNISIPGLKPVILNISPTSGTNTLIGQ